MYLFQILLPLYGAEGRRIAHATFESTANELAREFGGVTAYTRAPARGLWRKPGARAQRDDIVVYEVMSDNLRRRDWRERRLRFQRRFRQEQLVIRIVKFDRV